MKIFKIIKPLHVKVGMKLVNKIDQHLFVDPGFQTGLVSCQVAPFRKDTIIFSGIEISVDELFIDEMKYRNLLIDFDKILELSTINKIICEDVFFRGSSYNSIAAIKSQRLFKTVHIIGGYRAIALARRIDFSTLHAHIWKGQLNDKAVKERVHKKLLDKLIINKREELLDLKSSHVYSALGMALHTIGLFNEEK